MRNYTILSTKQLTVPQKELLLNTGIGYVEYNAVLIELLPTEKNIEVTNAIFTSKNAVKAMNNTGAKIKHCFCVGSNTEKLLKKLGYEVLETAQNALDLAKIIVKQYQNASFSFFCGNLRRDELPDYLNDHAVAIQEHVVYKTSLNSRSFDRDFDGILFFSPSAIQSFVSQNELKNSVAFCIGNTTAKEAQKYTNNIVVANQSTIENVIVQAVKYFK